MSVSGTIPPGLRVKAMDRDHCVAVWNRTLIHIWRHGTSVDAVQEMVETGRKLLATARGPVTVLGIIEKSSPPPEGAARDALARWSRDDVPKMALGVMVADGGGFRAALVRGVGITLSAVMKHRVPFKFVADVHEAAVHLAPHLPPGGGEDLLAIVQHLRHTMDTEFP